MLFRFSLAFLSVSLLSGCMPAALIGGGALVTSTLIKEQSVGESIGDSKIAAQVRYSLYEHDADLFHDITVHVQNAEVMLTGNLDSVEKQLDALRLTWDIRGVKRVIDNISVEEEGGLKEIALDGWITTQVKSQMVFDPDILSRNYTVHTFKGHVYIMGIAQDKEELNELTHLIRNTRNVKKVVSYVHLKDDPGLF